MNEYASYFGIELSPDVSDEERKLIEEVEELAHSVAETPVGTPSPLLRPLAKRLERIGQIDPTIYVVMYEQIVQLLGGII